MKRMILVAALAATPAISQEADPSADDCAFLQKAFADLYKGMRADLDINDAPPVRVSMYVQIQTNILLMAQVAECDMGPMVDVAREQLQGYQPGKSPD